MGFLSKLFGYADKLSNLEEKFESPVSNTDESRQAYQSSAFSRALLYLSPYRRSRVCCDV